MKLAWVLIATYVTFVVETSAAPLLGWGSFAPRLVFGGLVWAVWCARDRTGVALAAMWGLVSDGLSAGPLGIDMVVFVLAAVAIGWNRDHARHSLSAITATVGLVTLAAPIAGAGARLALAQQPIELERLLLAAAGPAGSTALLTGGLLVAWRLAFGRSEPIDAGPVAHVSNCWRMLTD